MKNIFNFRTTTGLLCLLGFVSINAFAQKLPSKQEGSLRAPVGIKTDGKANEWTFQAYNNATEVFYAIANDADNIYFAIKATDEAITRKILSGGITFTISSPGKKADTDAAAITYPLFNYKNKPDLKFSLKAVPEDSVDYFVTSNNKRMASAGKFFRVAGIKGLDSLVSVYNTDGVRVASAFDNEMSYTYEVAISRRHIAHFVNAEGKFFYNVTINPLKMDDMPGITIKRNAGGTILSVDVRKDSMIKNVSQSISNPTDFSGEYTLTK